MANIFQDVGSPNIWLRSFFGFDPTQDGYIGWTLEAGRDHIIQKAKSGDLMLVYGADTAETLREQRRQALGLLMVDLDPIKDTDKSSPEGLQRKRDAGWQDKWTFALPVRRAWRIERRIDIQHLAQESYDPAAGQAIAAWSRALSPSDIERVLQLPVTEVDVFGEPPVGVDALKDAPFRQQFVPSRGVPPSFGQRSGEYEDGPHKLYMAKFEGDAAALLGRGNGLPRNQILIKVGMSNAPKRRQKELNSGLPPAAVGQWNMVLLSADYPDGASAKTAEDILKTALANKFESQGGEFFLGVESSLASAFYSIPGIAKFSIRGR